MPIKLGKSMYIKKIVGSIFAVIGMLLMIAVPSLAAERTQTPTEAAGTLEPEAAAAETQAESAEMQADSGTELQADSEAEAGGKLPAESEAAEETSVPDTNQELMEQQEIISLPQMEEAFRFAQIDKVYAVSKKNNLKIRAQMNGKSQVVGEINRWGLLYIIQKEADNWYYIESGDVRGFVKGKYLYLDEKAEKLVRRIGEDEMETAAAAVSPWKNEAIDYTRTTTQKVVAKKRYGIAVADQIYIREARKEETNVVGVLQQGGLCYILKTVNQKWVYVESDVARGFVKRDELITGKEARMLVEEQGEENFPLADIVLEPAENSVCYYTLTSIKEDSVASSIRASIVEYAQQFIGNPYVWGGTSLTQGADCSGFVQSVYAQYGYHLPRVAEDQAQYGTKINVADAGPGDLIFYARNGYIYHVVMSIGDGKTVEAQSSATGIVISTVNYENAVWATRVIAEEDTEVYETILQQTQAEPALSESNVTAGEFLGTFKLTAYCACVQCCGVWAGGTTAGGTIPAAGRTVAMAGVPFGTKLLIGDQIYTVEDRGTVYGHVDVFMNSHAEAASFGVRYADVYTANESW